MGDTRKGMVVQCRQISYPTRVKAARILLDGPGKVLEITYGTVVKSVGVAEVRNKVFLGAPPKRWPLPTLPQVLKPRVGGSGAAPWVWGGVPPETHTKFDTFCYFD